MKRTTRILRKLILKLAASAAVVGLILLALAGCKDFSFFNELGVKGGLTITPASVSIVQGSVMSFKAYGGNGDYVFSIISGGNGSIIATTGVYTAPSTVPFGGCTDIVMVTDSTNLSATATVKVVDYSLDELEINPKVATLSPGGQITFVATGGTAPYNYSFQKDLDEIEIGNESGGTITSGGVYTAGPISGVHDTIIVTDADLTVCAIPADVWVMAAQTYVDYDITDAVFPPSAYTGDTMSGTFTITNIGADNGNKPVSWWLYLSDDGSFATGGETLIATNSTSALDHGESADITPPGTWPTESGKFELLVMISAEDDMSHGNNVENVGTIELGRPKVDFEVVSVKDTTVGGTKIPGASLDGEFTYVNHGPETGLLDLTWEVYASLNAAKSIDPADVKIASGTIKAPLGVNPATPVPVGFSGSWPLDGGDYYLKAVLISPDDDQVLGNNTNASTVTRIGIYGETEPNDEWIDLPGTGGFNILEGASPPNPIVLKPGMSIRIEGADISKDNRDDVFLFNTGTANRITFTVTWSSGTDDIDIYIWRDGHNSVTPIGTWVAEILGYRPDYLSGVITRGSGYGQFETAELWLDIYCHIGTGGPSTPVPYTVVITAE